MEISTADFLTVRLEVRKYVRPSVPSFPTVCQPVNRDSYERTDLQIKSDPIDDATPLNMLSALIPDIRHVKIYF